MFQDCEDLINVNLSLINSPLINSSIYTFTGCTNLEQVDFTSVDTTNVKEMCFLFAGCENLVELNNFENLNASSVKVATGMFADCSNIMRVNLSTFNIDNIEDQSGMLVNNPSLRVVELYNCSDANEFFYSKTPYNLTMILDEEIFRMSGMFSWIYAK